MNKIINEIKHMGVLAVISNFLMKLITIFSSIWGFLLNIILLLIAFLTPIKDFFILLTVIVLIDFVLGVYINRKHIQSCIMRKTLVKFFFYTILISLTFAIENVIGVDFVNKVVFAVISTVELISICANMLIINPSLKVLRLFQKLFKSEIAQKLGINIKEVEDVLSTIKKPKAE